MEINAASAPEIIASLVLISKIAAFFLIFGTTMITVGIAAIYINRRNDVTVHTITDEDYFEESFARLVEEVTAREKDRRNDDDIFENTEHL